MWHKYSRCPTGEGLLHYFLEDPPDLHTTTSWIQLRPSGSSPVLQTRGHYKSKMGLDPPVRAERTTTIGWTVGWWVFSGCCAHHIRDSRESMQLEPWKILRNVRDNAQSLLGPYACHSSPVSVTFLWVLYRPYASFVDEKEGDQGALSIVWLLAVCLHGPITNCKPPGPPLRPIELCWHWNGLDPYGLLMFVICTVWRLKGLRLAKLSSFCCPF